MNLFSSKRIAIGILSTLIVVVGIATPVRTDGTVSQAHAQLGLPTGVGILVNDVGNTLTNTLNTIATQALEQKALTLDPLFYQIAQMALQQLTSNILKFINSGFNGDPAFITDYPSYYQDAENDAAAKFIYGEGSFDSVCPSIRPQAVQAALSNTMAKLNDGYKEQSACTVTDPNVNLSAFVSGTFSAGGWLTWLELSLHPQNSEVGLYVDANLALDNVLANAKDDAKTEAIINGGFKSVKKCTAVAGTNGIGNNCTITTPGVLIKDQASFALQIPALDLLNADSFNEVVGSLFSNLATQALTGVNGLLGLGGNASYSSNTYGSGGNQSYLDAVQQQASQNSQTLGQTSGNEIQQAVVTENQVLQSELDIVSAIDDATTAYDAAKAPYASSSCWTLQIPTVLNTTLNQYVTQIPKTVQTVVTLQDMSDKFDKATSASAQLQLLQQLTSMQANGSIQGEAAVVQNGYILNGTVKQTIDTFTANIKTQTNLCK